MQSVIIFLGVLITVLGVLSFVFIPDFKGEINKDAKLFSVADAAEAIKTPGVLWACLGYFCVYCVYQGATYTTPYLSQAMGTDANTVNIIGLIRTYGIGLLAGRLSVPSLRRLSLPRPSSAASRLPSWFWAPSS